jgi:hypothetical protein
MDKTYALHNCLQENGYTEVESICEDKGVYVCAAKNDSEQAVMVVTYHSGMVDGTTEITLTGLPKNGCKIEVYLTDEGYSFPTWDEVRRYIDGEIDLPEKSVVLTFDDGTEGFRKYGVPLLNKYKVPATTFIIVSKNGNKWADNKDKYPYFAIAAGIKEID